MMVPVLSALKEIYPTLKITVLTRTQFAPIFNTFSSIEIFEADLKDRHKGFFGIYKLYKELRQLKLTAVADLHNVLRTNILKFFFKIAGINFVQINKGRKEKTALTRPKNKIFKQLKTTQERYTDVFKTLGFAIDLNKFKFLDNAILDNTIRAVTGDKKQKWIGIAPFAAHEGKMYPLHMIEKVIAILSKNEKYKILLFGGGEKEINILNGIETKFKKSILSVAGKLPFLEELKVLSNLDIMLSMDSGNGHLAVNYGVSVITLWGVTHPYAGFAPYAQPKENSLLSDRDSYPLLPTSVYGKKFPVGYEKVMETILPETVVDAIERVLNIG